MPVAHLPIAAGAGHVAQVMPNVVLGNSLFNPSYRPDLTAFDSTGFNPVDWAQIMSVKDFESKKQYASSFFIQNVGEKWTVRTQKDKLVSFECPSDLYERVCAMADNLKPFLEEAEEVNPGFIITMEGFKSVAKKLRSKKEDPILAVFQVATENLGTELNSLFEDKEAKTFNRKLKQSQGNCGPGSGVCVVPGNCCSAYNWCGATDVTPF